MTRITSAHMYFPIFAIPESYEAILSEPGAEDLRQRFYVKRSLTEARILQRRLTERGEYRDAEVVRRFYALPAEDWSEPTYRRIEREVDIARGLGEAGRRSLTLRGVH